jgi:hypothetical protein
MTSRSNRPSSSCPGSFPAPAIPAILCSGKGKTTQKVEHKFKRDRM